MDPETLKLYYHSRDKNCVGVLIRMCFFLNKKKDTITHFWSLHGKHQRPSQSDIQIRQHHFVGGKMLASTSMDHHRSVWWRAETTTTISTETDPHRLGTNKGTKHTRSSTATWTTRTTGADAPRQQAQPFWQVGRVHAFGRLGLCRAAEHTLSTPAFWTLQMQWHWQAHSSSVAAAESHARRGRDRGASSPPTSLPRRRPPTNTSKSARAGTW
jgi:hypothetical protein